MQAPVRCFWVSHQTLYQQYHDQEWGQPCFDEAAIFEQFCLEGQQAGLSWWTVLQKRECYRQHFFQYSISKIADFGDEHIEQSILQDTGVIRHRGKLFAIRHNAQLWLSYSKEFKTSTSKHAPMVAWLWAFAFYKRDEILAAYRLQKQEKIAGFDLDFLRSFHLSEQLKKIGFKFVGHQITHAFMQAVGMFNHHDRQCFCYNSVQAKHQTLFDQVFNHTL